MVPTGSRRNLPDPVRKKIIETNIAGLGLYRSQTADRALEVYRRAVGEYGVLKEMLTGGGRQYTNWRRSTRFEREIGKDRVKGKL